MRTVLQDLKTLILLCAIIGFGTAASAQCKFTTLTIPGSTGDSAIGINDNGAIVGGFLDGAGGHGYLLSQGKFSKFRFPGPSDTEALDINNFGQIVGDYTNNTGQHGFVVKNGAFRSISAPGR